ncbi:MAG: hypothetical protein IT288_06985 [Bdellovibrionales bacterium]|nr:hypothetical protein [Bdellovibrionales bacterium]
MKLFSNLSPWVLVVTVVVSGSLVAQAKPKKAASAKEKSTSAATLTPEQQAKFDEWQKYINDMDNSYAKYPVDMCGYEMPITMDKAMVEPFMKANANAELYCEEVRTKLSTICRNAAELGNKNKEKITKLVKKISCLNGKKETDVGFEAKGGELKVYLGPKAANISEEVLKFIDSQKN